MTRRRETGLEFNISGILFVVEFYSNLSRFAALYG
jgi:hypothetical protein